VGSVVVRRQAVLGAEVVERGGGLTALVLGEVLLAAGRGVLLGGPPVEWNGWPPGSPHGEPSTPGHWNVPMQLDLARRRVSVSTRTATVCIIETDFSASATAAACFGIGSAFASRRRMNHATAPPARPSSPMAAPT
jgi:hypothetical protein